MKIICNSTECTGCGACVNICPTDCVKLVDDNGFLYPEVDSTKCVDCNRCRRVCPQLEQSLNRVKNPVIDVYKTYSKDSSTIKDSTSGGIFSELAFWILKNNGVVFGAEFDREFKVRHSYISEINDIWKFRGSKYVGSNTLKTFTEVKEFLNKGRFVLFSGTPCQIDGLKAFLGRDYQNLYTMDFICHGVGSLKALRLYLKYLENIYNGKIVSLKFRDKANGYLNTAFCIEVEDELSSRKKYYFPSYQCPFGKLFAEGKINRESCSNCRYATIDRISDVTVADLVRDLDEKEAENGCSLVMINSEKGKMLFDSVKNNVISEKLNLNYATSVQQHLTTPQKKSKLREKILIDLDNLEFDDIINKYCNTNESNAKKNIVRIFKSLKHVAKKKLKNLKRSK